MITAQEWITAGVLVAIPIAAFWLGYLKGRTDGHHDGVIEELTRINKEGDK